MLPFMEEPQVGQALAFGPLRLLGEKVGFAAIAAPVLSHLKQRRSVRTGAYGVLNLAVRYAARVGLNRPSSSSSSSGMYDSRFVPAGVAEP